MFYDIYLRRGTWARDIIIHITWRFQPFDLGHLFVTAIMGMSHRKNACAFERSLTGDSWKCFWLQAPMIKSYPEKKYFIDNYFDKNCYFWGSRSSNDAKWIISWNYKLMMAINFLSQKTSICSQFLRVCYYYYY